MELYHDIHRACSAARLEAMIASVGDGGVCDIPRGEYYIARRVEIRGRKNLTINGNGSVILMFYDPCEHYAADSDAFLIDGCAGVTLHGFVLDTTSPASVTVTVTEVDSERGFYRAAADGAYRMCGREVFLAHYSADSEGTFTFGYTERHPDGRPLMIADEIIHMIAETGCRTEYLGSNEFVFHLSNGRSFLNRLKPGDRVCIRHTVYGPIAILIRNSDNTRISDITIYSAPGMGIVVLPRCFDLTLDGLHFKKHEDSPQLMSGNCDGVHITGLGGHFEMVNCTADGLGDDMLNLHSTAGTVSRIDGNVLRVNYSKKYPDGLLSPRFCRSGDRIRARDADSCERLGEFTVVDYLGDRLELKELDGELRVGCILQNLSFCPTAEIAHCDIRNSRSRGFIVQGGDTVIRDNRLFGMSGEGVKVGTVFKFYFETGIDGSFTVKDNEFVKCSHADLGDRSRVIAVLSRHTGADERVRGIYRRVEVSGNRFSRCGSSGSEARIVISSAERAVARQNGSAAVELIGCDEAETD